MIAGSNSIVKRSPPKKTPELLKEERRRARWQAFWTPIITLASVVSSVAMLMFFLRACHDRLPQFVPPRPAADAPAKSAAPEGGLEKRPGG